MSSVAFRAGRAQAEGRRRTVTGRSHDGPEPWSRRCALGSGLVLLLGLVGLVVAWAGAGEQATLTAQRGWLALAICSLTVGGLGMVAWLLIGLRTVAVLRGPVLAELRRRKQAELAARPRAVPADRPLGFGAIPGTRRYHRADCLMLAGKDADFHTPAEHVEAGRIPCGVCLPEGSPDA